MSKSVRLAIGWAKDRFRENHGGVNVAAEGLSGIGRGLIGWAYSD